MRILYLCHRIPYPPNKGEKIRAYHQLRAIAETHNVDLFTLADDPSDLEYTSTLAKYCDSAKVIFLNSNWGRLRSIPFLLSRKPLTIPYFYSPKLQNEVRQALGARSYDRIFVYCSAMAQYVRQVDGIPIITDLVDVDSDKWMQYANRTRFPISAVYRRESHSLREYERQICGRSSCVVVSTEREASLAREFARPELIRVISNGVDVDYFNMPTGALAKGVPTVTFTGDMSYFPNADAVVFFAEKVLPFVRAAIPDTRFLIVGRNPGSRVKALAKSGGVEVTGFVPDIRTYLSQTHVAVAPFLIAAGIQNKILEAMAAGLPVVATSCTARGLAPEVAEIVETADTPEEIASKVVNLLRENLFAQGKGVEGRRRVMASYSWRHSMEELLAIINNPTAGAPRLGVPQTTNCESTFRV